MVDVALALAPDETQGVVGFWLGIPSVRMHASKVNHRLTARPGGGEDLALFDVSLTDVPALMSLLMTGPHALWPESRGWMYTSDLDTFSSYVGGSGASVEALSGSPLLESVTVGPDDLRE